MDPLQNVTFTKEIDRLNMNISEVVYSVLDPHWRFHLCSSFTRVYMVTKGEGWLRTAEQTVRMTPGNIYLVPAGLAFDTECPVSMEKLYVHINILRYNRYDLFDGHPRIITLSDCKPWIEACVEDYRKGVFSLKQRLWQIVDHAVRQENIRWGGIEVYSQPVKSAIGRIEKVVRAAADGQASVDALGVGALAGVGATGSVKPFAPRSASPCAAISTTASSSPPSRNCASDISPSPASANRWVFAISSISPAVLPPATGSPRVNTAKTAHKNGAVWIRFFFGSFANQ